MENNEKLTGAARIAERAQIKSVRLIQLQSDLNPKANPLGMKEYFAGIDRNVRFEGASESTIACYIDLAFRAREKGTDAPFLSIKACFELLYEISDNSEVNENDLKSFCEFNAVFNVWPYWRELIQNQAARMGCPPITMPLFKIQPRKPLKTGGRASLPRKLPGLKKSVRKNM